MTVVDKSAVFWYLDSQNYSRELAAHLDGDKGEEGADAVDGGPQQY